MRLLLSFSAVAALPSATESANSHPVTHAANAHAPHSDEHESFHKHSSDHLPKASLVESSTDKRAAAHGASASATSTSGDVALGLSSKGHVDGVTKTHKKEHLHVEHHKKDLANSHSGASATLLHEHAVSVLEQGQQKKSEPGDSEGGASEDADDEDGDDDDDEGEGGGATAASEGGGATAAGKVEEDDDDDDDDEDNEDGPTTTKNADPAVSDLAPLNQTMRDSVDKTNDIQAQETAEKEEVAAAENNIAFDKTQITTLEGEIAELKKQAAQLKDDYNMKLLELDKVLKEEGFIGAAPVFALLLGLFVVT